MRTLETKKCKKRLESPTKHALYDSSRQLFTYFVNGFDLALYLVEKDEFYYIDNIQHNEVLKLKDREDWDGKYIMERVEFAHTPEPEPEVIFEYKDVRDLWLNLKIHGLSLKEVIDRSVVMVMH